MGTSLTTKPCPMPPLRTGHFAAFGNLFHSITLSARAKRLAGMERPIAFAVFKLIANSNLVGSSTGRSAGATPFRTFPV